MHSRRLRLVSGLSFAVALLFFTTLAESTGELGEDLRDNPCFAFKAGRAVLKAVFGAPYIDKKSLGLVKTVRSCRKCLGTGVDAWEKACPGCWTGIFRSGPFPDTPIPGTGHNTGMKKGKYPKGKLYLLVAVINCDNQLDHFKFVRKGEFNDNFNVSEVIYPRGTNPKWDIVFNDGEDWVLLRLKGYRQRMADRWFKLDPDWPVFWKYLLKNYNKLIPQALCNKLQCMFPDELCCPVGLSFMEDPVTAADGHNYERREITKLFKRHRENVRSPVTGRLMAHRDLVPNEALKADIQEHKENMYIRRAVELFEARS